MRGMKKLLSLLLCLCMLAQNVPVAVFAAGDAHCAHHEEHTAQCGYVSGVACSHVCGEGCQLETTACVHIHGEDGCSYVEATQTEAAVGECNHTACTVDSGCVKIETVCTHTVHEDCGYVAGAKCTFDSAACSECADVQEEIFCTCESEDPGEHAPFCDLYVRTYEECKCVLNCAVEGLNDWCEICYFEGVEACGGGEEERIPYAEAEAEWTVSGEPVTGTLAQAVAAAVAGHTSYITLLKDVETNSLNITAGEFTINLNRKTIMGNSGNVFNVTGGKVTFDGNGTIQTIDAITAPYTLRLASSGEVTLKSGTIIGRDAAVVVAKNSILNVQGNTELKGNNATYGNIGIYHYTGTSTVNLKEYTGEELKIYLNAMTVLKARIPLGSGYGYFINGEQIAESNSAVNNNQVLTVKKVATTYTVNAYANPTEGGTVTGGGSYSERATVTLTATPAEGYTFKEWQVVSGGVTVENNSFTMPASNVEIKAVFEAVPTAYSITIGAAITNGSVSADRMTALENETITLTVTPNEGYKLKSLMVDGSNVTTQVVNNQYAFSMPGRNVTVSATFQVIEYPVKVQGVMVTALNKSDVLGNGTVSYDPATFTLALNNASISYESGAAIQSVYPDYTLKIVGTGTNTISATGGSGIYANHQNISISGGTFLISGSTNGIFAEVGNLTIDGAQVKAVGTNNGAYAKNGIAVTNGGGLLAVTGNKAAVRGTYTMGAENIATLAVSEGAKLIVESGKTVTVSDYITSSGVIEIQGTLKVPAGSGKSTMSGGILYIGTKGYRWDAAKNAYVCLEHDWSYRLKTGTTDTVEAYCDECQSTSSDVLTLSKLTREVYNGPGTTEAALNEYNESVFADVGKILYQKKDGGTAIDRPLTDAGTYIASVTVGSGENAVTASVEYTIAPKPVTLTVTLKANTKVYDGTTTAEVDTATAVGVIRADNQVAVQYGEANYNSPNVADAKEVHFTGWGLTGHRSENYILSAQPVSVTATITAKSLEDAAAALSDNVIFNGEPVPELTVKDGDRILEKDKDYTVVQTGSNGEFTMTITGIGNYKDDAAAKPAYLVVTLPDPDKVEPDDKDAIDAYEYYTDRNKTYKDAELEKALNALKEALTAYDVIKGHKSSYTKRSGKTFSLTANGYFGKFTGLKVDGKLLDSKYYTAKSGSTIVTLKNSYLDGLSDGKHAIEFLYTDGSTGDGHYFRIATNNGSPITGDNNHIAMFTGIMMTSLLCMVMMFMLVTRKKGKYER